MTSKDTAPVALPGFRLPLDYIPNENDPGYIDEPFPSALFDISGGAATLPLTTLREFTMLHVMNKLTDKPGWHKKVFDEETASKWKAEMLGAEGMVITEKMALYCITELRYKARVFAETGAISVYNADVVKSDTAVPSSLKMALHTAVGPLEDIPARLKDWHPDSDGKVLNLVHPSLFPLVYGRTRILAKGAVSLEDCIARSGEGVPVPLLEIKKPQPPRYMWNHTAEKNPYSERFQWLPCEVDISGDVARITSYINNLHPQKHPQLYTIIEQIITQAIPLWNMTLTPLKIPNEITLRIHYSACIYNPDPENGPEGEGPQREEDEDEHTFLERRRDWYQATRRVVQPEPEAFEPPNVEFTVDLKKEYGERGLQVIVKLSNIELTPEKPVYEGGTWHVEGQANEHICATALYYYSSDNITTSELAFRQQSAADADDIDYEQEHHDWLPVVFGCQQNGPAIQVVGSVATPEGRLLTFPNILQHQVQPFRLADPTKPGHRKILALFLVDPNIRVISTKNVPSQRKDWWRELIQLDQGRRVGLTDLPAELQDRVFKEVEEFPVSLEEAREVRLELMEERRKFVIDHGDIFESEEFSLCEH